MYDLRLKIFPAVFGVLAVSAPISAAPVEEEIGTQSASSESIAESQPAQDDSLAATESAPVPESAPVTDSDTAIDSAPVIKSDLAAEPAPVVKSPPVTESDPVIKTAAVTVSDATPAASGRKSVNLSFLISSIYNYRGLNVYKETSQADQNALFSPAVTWTVLHPGLWLKYAGFFQINGDNRGYLVDAGVGAEQDIAVGFDYELSRKLKLSTSLTYFFYPFALSRITGVEWPSYLEPAVGIHYKTDSDFRLGLQISYFAPIQERLRDQRYMYSLVTAGKEVQFLPQLALDFDLSFGYKLFADPSIWQDTIFNLEFCVSLPYTIVDNLKLVPGTHAAWAYFVGTHFGDQYMIYFSLDLVADF